MIWLANSPKSLRRVPRIFKQSAAIAVLASALSVVGCDKKEAPTAAPPPPVVGVVTLKPQSVSVTRSLPGRVNSVLLAEVRARVDGIVLQRDFVEGGDVKAGQRLFQIDPAPYKASLDSALATQQKAAANVATTAAQLRRYKTLLAGNAVSRQDYDNTVASAAEARADLASAKASVETARINLGYTNVVSPITGRAGIASVTVGAYVQSSAATLMATVQQFDPIYVDVTEPTIDLLQLRRDAAAGKFRRAGPDEVGATLLLEDGSAYPLPGLLKVSDITVDESTGSVTLRSIFPNPQHDLLPGMFVHARLDEGVNDQALLVPQTGIIRNARGEPTALVVGANNRVESRVLKASEMVGQNWIVEAGLKPGEKVIVDGVQKAKSGAIVSPVDAAPTGAPSQP